MHILLGLSSILLVFLNGCIHLYMLRSLADWTLRRVMQLFVLFIPFFSLGVNALHPFLSHDCFNALPSWSELLEVALPSGMLAIVCGAICWGMIRWLFMLRLVTRRGFPASADVDIALYHMFVYSFSFIIFAPVSLPCKPVLLRP